MKISALTIAEAVIGTIAFTVIVFIDYIEVLNG